MVDEIVSIQTSTAGHRVRVRLIQEVEVKQCREVTDDFSEEGVVHFEETRA